jgi:hypothetical protein
MIVFVIIAGVIVLIIAFNAIANAGQKSYDRSNTFIRLCKANQEEQAIQYGYRVMSRKDIQHTYRDLINGRNLEMYESMSFNERQLVISLLVGAMGMKDGIIGD